MYTEITFWQGNVSYRNLHESNTKIYMDQVLETIEWENGIFPEKEVKEAVGYWEGWVVTEYDETNDEYYYWIE